MYKMDGATGRLLELEEYDVVYHSDCGEDKDHDDKAEALDQEHEGDGDSQRLLDRAKVELEKEGGARAGEAGADSDAKMDEAVPRWTRPTRRHRRRRGRTLPPCL